MNLGLQACEEHYNLHRDVVGKLSQLSFQRNENGDRCLVYTEDNSTKTHDGGIKDMQKEKKLVWVFPSND